MSHRTYTSIAIALGIVSAIYIPINNSVAIELSSIYSATFIFFTVALITSGIVLSINIHSKNQFILPKKDWWLYLSGTLTVAVILGGTNLVRQIGASNWTVSVVAGQVVSGLIISHFGILGIDKRPMNQQLIIGAILVLAGVYLVVAGQHNLIGIIEKPISIGLAFILGCIISVYLSMNSQMADKLDNAQQATFIYYLGATVLSLIVFLFYRNSTDIENLFNFSFWKLIAGILGFIVISGAIYVLPKLGAGSWTVLYILGQLISSVVIDRFGLFDTPQGTFSSFRVVGFFILLIGVYLVTSLSKGFPDEK